MRSEQRLLFLCTGNYYRSRFAHELWSHLEHSAPTGWRAESRGLSCAASDGNVGPISLLTLHALAIRGVRIEDPPRMPRRAEEADFASSNCIIAMSRREHRPMIEARFPDWVDAVKYWDVEDMHVCPPDLALARIESLVHELHRALIA
jgi:protein-tyrosine phosphatase